MSYYGGTVTVAGRNLITSLMAGKTIEFTRIMVGSGAMPEGVEPIDMVALVTPVAEGVSSVPTVENGVLSMVVEYRNDLNGGLQEGFWLREFGVFAKTEDTEEIDQADGLVARELFLRHFALDTVLVRRGDEHGEKPHVFAAQHIVCAAPHEHTLLVAGDAADRSRGFAGRRALRSSVCRAAHGGCPRARSGRGRGWSPFRPRGRAFFPKARRTRTRGGISSRS